MADTDTSHLEFARKLASNKLEVRTSAIKKVATFFATTDKELSEADLLKVWMGLFYAMWMSDKPHVQSELAKNIANLIHSHKLPANAIMFVRTFYTTMHQRFSSIDRLRHDKFLKLVRFFVNNSLAFLKNNDYDSELMDQFFAAQSNVWSRDDAQEIQLHVCDLFWDECFYACGKELPSEAAFRFAAFFVDTLEQTNHAILKARLFEACKAFIAGASYCSPKLAPKRKNGMETNKEMFPDVEFNNVNLEELEQWFLQRASTRKEILNRDTLYKLHDEALKKKRAEPGFKELPRGSIVKRVALEEEAEFARLMAEHEKSKTPEDRKEEAEAKMSRKDKKKLRKDEALKKAATEPKEVEMEKERETDQDMVNMNAATLPGQGKKNRKNKKQRGEASPAKPTEAPKTTTTTVISKKEKKNAAGQVIAKTEEIVETKVTEDANTKRTEVTTTTKEVKKGKKELPKEEKKAPEPVKEAPKQKGGKPAQQAEVAEDKPEEVTPKKKQAKTKAPVVEEAKPEEPPATKKQKKAAPTPAPAAAADDAPEETSTKKQATKSKTIPTPTPAPQTNGKASNKRKAAEAEVEAPTEVTPNGKTAEKKAKVSEAPAEETNGKVNGTPAKGKKGKGKKEEAAVEQSEDKTPKKTATTVTPPSLKKSVSFSKQMEHVKEFDKTEVVASTPVAPSPSSTKLKGVLNTPPRTKAPAKGKKN